MKKSGILESLVRSGFINKSSGSDGLIKVAGQYGYDWSSRSNRTDVRHAYVLGIYVPDMSSSSNFNRWSGYPLRCLARQQ